MADTRRHVEPAALAAVAPSLLLVAVAAAWGLSIGMSKDLLVHVPVLDYLGLRYALGFLVLVLLRPAVVAKVDRRDVRTGIILGLIFAAAQYVQFLGLTRASIVVAAFLVSLYVVFTPLLMALVRRRSPAPVVIVGTVLSLGGIALMSLRGWSFGTGELLTVVAALGYALHVIGQGRWSRPGRAVHLTAVQLGVMGAVFSVAALPGGLALPAGRAWAGLTFVGVVGGTAILAQAWAQARVGAEAAAVLLVLEPVWASLFAIVWWGESPSVRTVAGALLLIAASVIVVIGAAHERRRRLFPRQTASVCP